LQPGEIAARSSRRIPVRWAAFDVALMREGAIVVPLYSRQAPAELAAMMKDCQPRFLFVGDAAFGEGIAQLWPEAPPRVLFEHALQQPASPGFGSEHSQSAGDSDLVTIIYTSGTSGEP